MATMNLEDLLREMTVRGASDLHIKEGSPPGFRVNGALEPMAGAGPLSHQQCAALIDSILDPEQITEFATKRDLDFSKEISGLARYRVNLFVQRGHPSAVLRQIPLEIPKLEALAMPSVVTGLCNKPKGLVLVTGPTGSGKSTTLAAMIDYINANHPGHILTLEDPIEFVHSDQKCYVSQREVGSDSESFSTALRAALREDPDIILVGEMRDLETIGLAITAAETGHLVFGTLHTTSAPQTIDRVVDVFPHQQQSQVRTQMAAALQGVISQTLLPSTAGGRICAQEIMIGTDAVRNCVREGKTHQLRNMLQTGAQYGMQTLETHLAGLVQQRLVTAENAIARANDPSSLQSMLEMESVDAGPPRVAEPVSEATAMPARDNPASGSTHDDFESFRAKRQKGR